MIKTKALIIGISGGSGSGKTTLALALQERLGSDQITLLAQDLYYKDRSDIDYDQRQNVNYDHPDAVDLELLAENLRMLKEGKQVAIPVYDFETHTRAPEYILLKAGPIIVVEGILIYTSAAVRNICDLKVFIEAGHDLMFLRRMARDVLERGRTRESVENQYKKTVEPMFRHFVAPTRQYADLILHGDDPISDLVNRVVESVHKGMIEKLCKSR